MQFREYIEKDSGALVSSLREAVAIPSVFADDGSGTPYGAEADRCLKRVLAMAEEMGFRTCSVDGHCGWCEYGEGSEMVAVLAHLDVVPAGDGWTVSPFGGEIIDGKVFGRGTMDDKGPAVAALYALKAIKDSGAVISRRIRIIFGLNEESGSRDIKYYLEHGGEKPVTGFTPDGEYPLINGEKGIINVGFACSFEQHGGLRLKEIRGGTAQNIVPADAYAVFSAPEGYPLPGAAALGEHVTLTKTEGGFRLDAHGISAHGAHPEEGRNAIGLLMQAMMKLGLDGALGKAAAFLGTKIGTESDGRALGIALSDSLSGGLTLNLGVLRGDENGISVRLNYRYPVTCSFEDCAPALEHQFEEAGFVITDRLHKPSLFVSPDSRLVKTLLGVYREFTGDMSEPKCIGGGTYAKAIPNIVAFGPVFPGDEVREHKPDEFIEIDRLIDNADIISAAMYRLAAD